MVAEHSLLSWENFRKQRTFNGAPFSASSNNIKPPLPHSTEKESRSLMFKNESYSKIAPIAVNELLTLQQSNCNEEEKLQMLQELGFLNQLEL
jgi:hypothetical protein